MAAVLSLSCTMDNPSLGLGGGSGMTQEHHIYHAPYFHCYHIAIHGETITQQAGLGSCENLLLRTGDRVQAAMWWGVSANTGQASLTCLPPTL